MANYEKIKNMSVEEIAKFINECGHDFPPYCYYEKAINVTCDQNCLECAKQWLKQEEEE